MPSLGKTGTRTPGVTSRASLPAFRKRLFLNWTVLWVLLLAISWLVQPAEAQRNRTATSKREQAETYYQQALETQKTFQEIPFEKRTAGDYQRVIRAFRRVYHTD